MSGSPRIVLAVSGGIAAYKAAEVLRGFQKAGCEVRVTMTENAALFVGPLTFAALSGHPVSSGRLQGEDDASMAHVEVTRGAALFVVAPATASTIAKLACGIADDWLTTHALACEAPLLVAPAMNARMWRHPSVVANFATLVARGATIVEPETGDLACREVGAGRLADPASIVARGMALIASAGSSRDGDLAGLHVLVTSGPTHEPLDDVRFLGNRSSGRMGHAIAEAARARGASVDLVSGPVALGDPEGCSVARVATAAQMADAVGQRLPRADIAVFAAAVADYRPEARPGKLRREDAQRLDLALTRTRDTLAEAVAAAHGALLVGMAAEVGPDWLASARAKFARKGCHLLVANRVDGPSSAFDAEDNEVVIFGPGAAERAVPRASKRAIADAILDSALAARRGSAG